MIYAVSSGLELFVKKCTQTRTPPPCPPPPSQVPLSEVESWVVMAIAEGLIDARMEQTASSVSVTRAMQRDFGQAQWTTLQTKLRAWRDSVASLLALVEGGVSRA